MILNSTFDPNINLGETNWKPSAYSFEMVPSKRGEGNTRKKIYYYKDMDTQKIYPYCRDIKNVINLKMYTLNMSWLPPREFSEIYKPLQTMVECYNV